jgi:NADH dehydrogenase (ubiquinone) Fe-S protein 3
LTAGDELELLIAPDGIIPTFTFLKDHHNTQFVNLTDITALDVPSRQYRFEVTFILYIYTYIYMHVYTDI